MNTSRRILAEELFNSLRAIDGTIQIPSSEQSLIINSDLRPAVVIAGAGSGKTETMSARVLYLVANGFAKPDEILGLTFTRKAAGELSTRIRKRLRLLRNTPLIQDKSLGLDVPVMTYHAYAGRLLGEHAIRCGIDAPEEPIGEAQLWQMTFDLVTNWPDDNFRSESALETVVKDVLGLAKNILEHEISEGEVQRETEQISLEILEQLVNIEASGSKSNESVRKIQTVLQQRLDILPMAKSLIDIRRRDGLLSFDDQMSLAARIASQFPDVGEIERSRYKVVLLDEYQDTSQSQVRMLSKLFGNGHPVMAVGDPCQAIYTWRGASAGTIGAFSENFPHVGKGENIYFSLPTTYRNDRAILDFANQLSANIRQNGPVRVEALQSRPHAGLGELACGVYENIESEAASIAEYFAHLWFAPERQNQEEDQRSTFAVLVRKGSQIAEIEAALRKIGIPVEVLGVGGLIHVAEVADLIALLKVVTDPDAGAALMRHLTGPRINLGAADIAALGRYSRSMAESMYANSKNRIAKIALGNPDQEEADDQFQGSVIDALDEIADARQSDFSKEGFIRLTNFAADLRRLRGRAGGSLVDLISEIEAYLFLEVDVSLRDWPQNGRRHLDRFLDEAAKFSRSGGSVREFLTWLSIAEAEESGLKSGAPDVRSDVVTILTIHMAKGAEWDVVAIPGLAEKSFPSSGREKENWLTNEKHIPFEIRGDASQLPKFTIQHCTSNVEVKKALEAFSLECEVLKHDEEIRLGYVAITRAKTHLLCTTSHWRDGVKAVAPSEIYNLAAELASSGHGVVLSEVGPPADSERNPRSEIPETMLWPRDWLQDDRGRFDESVDLVLSSNPHSTHPDEDAEIDSWIVDAKALIGELRQGKKSVDVFLPPRLSVSTLVALRQSPEELALSIRRPMPRSQDQYSRRGTVFHLWIEKYLGRATLFDDDELDAADALESDQTLDGLKSKWLESEWAQRTPVAVEVPFETVFSGVLVRGRIDAVYSKGDLFDVVDWKTGSKKLGEAAAVQLAVYRLAWAQLHGVDISRVRAAFHYVPTGITDRPADLLDEEGLIALLEKI